MNFFCYKKKKETFFSCCEMFFKLNPNSDACGSEVFWGPSCSPHWTHFSLRWVHICPQSWTPYCLLMTVSVHPDYAVIKCAGGDDTLTGTWSRGWWGSGLTATWPSTPLRPKNWSLTSGGQGPTCSPSVQLLVPGTVKNLHFLRILLSADVCSVFVTSNPIKSSFFPLTCCAGVWENNVQNHLNLKLFSSLWGLLISEWKLLFRHQTDVYWCAHSLNVWLKRLIHKKNQEIMLEALVRNPPTMMSQCPQHHKKQIFEVSEFCHMN